MTVWANAPMRCRRRLSLARAPRWSVSGLVLLLDGSAAPVEFLGSALELDEFDHPGLVEVDESLPFSFGGARLGSGGGRVAWLVAGRRGRALWR